MDLTGKTLYGQPVPRTDDPQGPTAHRHLLPTAGGLAPASLPAGALDQGSIVLEEGTSTKVIGIKFDLYKPHTDYNPHHPAKKCIEFSNFVYIAHLARVRFVVEGLSKSAKTLADEGTLFVKSEIRLETQRTHHNRSVSIVYAFTTEYWRLKNTGTSVNLDYHSYSDDFQPWDTGVCRISSVFTMYLSLIVLPGAKDMPFLQTGGITKKTYSRWQDVTKVDSDYDPADPDQNANSKGRLDGAYQPEGWQDQVWKVEYPILTSHCGHPAIPYLKKGQPVPDYMRAAPNTPVPTQRPGTPLTPGTPTPVPRPTKDPKHPSDHL